MLCFDAIGLQIVLRKILEIERHNDVSASADRRSQYVPVFRVWACNSVNECLVASHKTISDMSVHQVPRSLKLFGRQVRSVFENISGPFVVDGIGPFGAVEVRHRHMHQQVTKGSRIEDAGVIQNSEIAHFSSPCRVPAPELPVRPMPSAGYGPLSPYRPLNPEIGFGDGSQPCGME